MGPQQFTRSIYSFPQKEPFFVREQEVKMRQQRHSISRPPDKAAVSLLSTFCVWQFMCREQSLFSFFGKKFNFSCTPPSSPLSANRSPSRQFLRNKKVFFPLFLPKVRTRRLLVISAVFFRDWKGKEGRRRIKFQKKDCKKCKTEL